VGEAAERITAALETLEPSDAFDPDVARLNERLSSALVWAGDYQRAAPAVETALTVAEALELPDVLADALIIKAVLYQQTGRPQEARGCTPRHLTSPNGTSSRMSAKLPCRTSPTS
jgi:hypothetical protein